MPDPIIPRFVIAAGGWLFLTISVPLISDNPLVASKHK